ncbi:MAG TPA: BON domain-containing protein [Trebonia sp.]|nr:BON domain-containing protein [Trebonia sp.]
MNEDVYVAGQIERALREGTRTHELGVRVEVDGESVTLRGQVQGEERRRLIAQVAAAAAPGRTVINEVAVTEPLPPETPEMLPLPEEVLPVGEVPPPRSAPGGPPGNGLR